MGGDFFLAQISLGTSEHSSTGFKVGTNFVTCLHSLCGFKSQVSSGTCKKHGVRRYSRSRIRFTYILNCSLLFLNAFLWALNKSTSWRSTHSLRHFEAFGFWCDFLHQFWPHIALLDWPFFALLFRGIALLNQLTFVFFHLLAVRDVINNIMLMVPAKMFKY